MAGPKPIDPSPLAQTAPSITGGAQGAAGNCDADDAIPPTFLWVTFETKPPSRKGGDWDISVREKGVDSGGVEQPRPGEACLLVEVEGVDNSRTALLVPDPLVDLGENGEVVRREGTHSSVIFVPLATNSRRITLWMNFNKPVFDCIGEAGRLVNHIDLGGWDEAKAYCPAGELELAACQRAADPLCVFRDVKFIPIPPALPRRTPAAPKPPPPPNQQGPQNPMLDPH